MILERGSPDSIYLNVAIALLSMAVSLIVSLASADIKRMGTFVVLIVLSVVGCIGGTILLILWWRSRRSVSDCSKVIRDRLPPEGTLATTTNDSAVASQCHFQLNSCVYHPVFL